MLNSPAICFLHQDWPLTQKPCSSLCTYSPRYAVSICLTYERIQENRVRLRPGHVIEFSVLERQYEIPVAHIAAADVRDRVPSLEVPQVTSRKQKRDRTLQSRVNEWQFSSPVRHKFY
jgi:hypothetical protein